MAGEVPLESTQFQTAQAKESQAAHIGVYCMSFWSLSGPSGPHQNLYIGLYLSHARKQTVPMFKNLAISKMLCRKTSSTRTGLSNAQRGKAGAVKIEKRGAEYCPFNLSKRTHGTYEQLAEGKKVPVSTHKEKLE